MEERRLVEYEPFSGRLDEEMKFFQSQCDYITCFFQEPRHVEEIKGTMEDDNDRIDECRKNGKERLRTVSVAIVMCLHLGVDPPDAPPRKDAKAKLLCWVDPYKCGPHRAALDVATACKNHYDKWQPKSTSPRSRTKYKICTDPPIDDIRKIASNMRRISGNDRVLFHYNGHGVPRPTENGEIWVFNKSFTQYIPLSIFDLQAWLEFPAVYIWETHSAETAVKNFQRFAEDHEIAWQSRFDKWQEESLNLPQISTKMSEAASAQAMGYSEKFPLFRECIHLAACRAGEFLPMSDEHLPADLFTCCLTTPILTSLAWHLSKSGRRHEFPENILEMIPGNLSERRTVLGELNWIFTAVTDTIAFTSIERDIFQKLFRQDLLLATLFRSFLLAQRVMGHFKVLPVSWPHIKNTANHELWSCWDATMDMVLDYVREIVWVKRVGSALMSGRDVLIRSSVFPFLTMIDFDRFGNMNDQTYNQFFMDQLIAFEIWLDYGIDKGTPPLQLPMVLQVLLSQTHRSRALRLLARFLDFGRWAVGYSLAVGIFPYVLRLLQSNTRELKASLAFIWAKILAVDPLCQMELFKENSEDGGASNGPAPPTAVVAASPQGRLPPGAPGQPQQYAFPHLHPLGQPPQQPPMRQILNQPQIGGRFQTNQTQTMEFQNQYAALQQMQKHADQQSQRGPGSVFGQPGAMQHMGNPIQLAAQQGQQTQPKKNVAPLRYLYFVQILHDPDIAPKQKIVPAFVLAMLTHNNYKKAQEQLTSKGFVNLCTELLCDPEASQCQLLKLWLLIGMGRLWSDYDTARWQAVRLCAYDKVIEELEDKSAEVRAAAVFALGSLLKNASQTNEHASTIDEQIADELCNRCVFDGSVLVRQELLVSLQWFVFDFERRFVKLLIDLCRPCGIKIPEKADPLANDEGEDIAAKMSSTRSKSNLVDFTQPTMNRKKMSTSVFNTACEEAVLNDSFGRVYTVGYDIGKVEGESEDVEFRKRAMAQIKHLEGKTFNESIARTWLALLRLSLDPVEAVARMAQKIVKRVEDGTHAMENSLNSTLKALNNKKVMEKKKSHAMKLAQVQAAALSNSTRGTSTTASTTSYQDYEEFQNDYDQKLEAAFDVPIEKHQMVGETDLSEVGGVPLAEQIRIGLETEKELADALPYDDDGVRAPATQIDFKVATEEKKKRIEDMRLRILENDRKQNKVLKKVEEAAKVRFQVGSPAVENSSLQNDGSHSSLSYRQQQQQQNQRERHPILEIKSTTDEQGSDLANTLDDLDEDFDLLHADSDSDHKELKFGDAVFADIFSKSFTPKRVTVGKGNFSKPGDSKTLRTVIENPIVETCFVEWCSRIFVEPILHVIPLDDQNDPLSDVLDDTVLTKTTPSDWAIHALEGMRQSAEIEGINYCSTRYDHCLWRARLSHPANCLVTSKLRRCMYATDGRNLTIIRQDVESRHFRKFDLTDGNPFNQDNVSQLLLINEMSREMLLACSRNGTVRIWDPFFTSWSEDYEKPPEMVSAGYPLSNQMKLSDESNRCLFDWNQETGRLLVTGPKSVRVWDAHYEKTVRDIPYPTGIGANSGAKHDKNTMPTAMSADLDESGNLVAIGYADGKIDVFDMRMERLRAMKMATHAIRTNSTIDSYERAQPSIMCLQLRKKPGSNYLFAGNRDGVITKWEPRMYREPTTTISANWEAGQHTAMHVHNDARIMASASGSNLVIYDVATTNKTATIGPPLQSIEEAKMQKTSTFGFLKSDRKLSQPNTVLGVQTSAAAAAKHRIPKITALTMHQMRLMTVVGYDDNTVCVYGSLKPGLTAHYDTNRI